MKILVIYDSVFGNTEKIAAAMGDAINAKAIKITDITRQDLDDLDLLIIGSPTRAFRPTPAVAAWIKGLKSDSLSGVKVAAFDTRVSLELVNSRFLNFMVKLFGYAAKPMSEGLVKKGGVAVSAPEGFYVTGNEGPLLEKELSRASAWAQKCQKG